ncbi:MAG: helix-turn-helix domain-containing protein [Candidatus Eremiobacteraeota bacterium]|nr:helix-turn-helix domain-containing protein [Candidatus Eremiobacteraeota bacterium]
MSARGLRRWLHDGPLGCFEMYEWVPEPASQLCGVVERIWHWDGSPAESRERVFPDVTLELVVQLDRAYRPVVDGKAGEAFPLVCIEGLRGGAATIEAPRGRCRVLGLRFTPPAVCALLRRPLGDVAGRTIDLHDAIGQSARELSDRCGDAADAPSRIAVAARWVAARMTAAEPDPLARWCTESIVASGGRVRVEALADATGLSSARLARRFVTHVGMTPKRFARLARFRRSLDALTAGASIRDVVYEGGYYDQPHFNAEFGEHTGLSPTAFLRASKFPQGTSLSEAAPR